jgi:hypothetical protein
MLEEREDCGHASDASANRAPAVLHQCGAVQTRLYISVSFTEKTEGLGRILRRLLVRLRGAERAEYVRNGAGSP